MLADGPRLFVDRGTTWPAAIPVVYVLAAAAVGTAVFRMERKFRRKLAKVPELNAYLAEAKPARREKVFEEPTDFDAELLEWVYDMALAAARRVQGVRLG